MTEVPALVSQEVFDRVQAKLAINRGFARRNNTAHPYLLRALVSCGTCGLACSGRATSSGHRYYSCVGKRPPVYSRREEHCPSRLSPAQPLDDLVWADLCAMLAHPEQIRHALGRAHGGHWLPQEWQARREGLRTAQAGLERQLERLTQTYLSGVIPLDEYQRRRTETERRGQSLEQQRRELEAQGERSQELAGLACSMEEFCTRVRRGLDQATFEQQRQLVELLIDRVIVADGEVEIRYALPTGPPGEKTRFCHLRIDYRARPPGGETAGEGQRRVPFVP